MTDIKTKKQRRFCDKNEMEKFPRVMVFWGVTK